MWCYLLTKRGDEMFLTCRGLVSFRPALRSRTVNNTSLEFAYALPMCGSVNVESKINSFCSAISRKLVEKREATSVTSKQRLT